MKIIINILLFAIVISVSTLSFAAKDPKENAIKARQGEMQLRAFNVGPLFGMVKGRIPYDAELAGKLAGNLKLMLDLDNDRAWMQGTDIGAYPGKTTALAKVWTTSPEIAEYGKNYVKAVNELASVAGSGIDGLKSKIGPVGKACKACHDDFRELP